MHIIKAIGIAFSRYSRIPVPVFDWEEKDFGLSLGFLPWVGAVIGAAAYLFFEVLEKAGVPVAAEALLLAGVPVLFTGGFHIDGYMDTADARASFKSREERLAILKDPRTGAFAVIGLLLKAAVFLAGLIIILSLKALEKKSFMLSFAYIFIAARCLCGFAVLFLPKARKDGMAAEEKETAMPYKRGLFIWLFMQLAAAFLGMGSASFSAAASAAAGCGFTFLWFVHMCFKEFGGLTGDLAGYFVVVCEVNAVLSMSAAALFV